MIRMTKEYSKKRGAPKKDPNNVRSERINVVLTPDTLENLKTLVALNDDSMNNYIHELIDNEVEKKEGRIQKYREFMEEMDK